MKLRVRGSSIRLRLTRVEVDNLVGPAGMVHEDVCFAPGVSLGYRLRRGKVSAVEAVFDGSNIEVVAPDALIERWASTDEVGFEVEQIVPGGVPLRILVEKDWNCLTPRSGEDDSDSFENPNKAC